MSRPRLNEACTKIVATVGPACDSVEGLSSLIEEGVDVFRINTAHGSLQQHAEKLANIRAASERTGFPVGVLLDLAGPKIRLGQLVNEPLQCDHGDTLTFIRGDQSGNPNELTSSYTKLVDELDVGDPVMLADGTVTLEVQSVTPDQAVCKVIAGGEIRSRQGINLPGVKLSVSAMRPSDVENAIWATQNEIDFISLSFVRTAEDVRTLKDLLKSYDCSAIVIAKIEKPEALDNLDAIVETADGVMVARGDLGVEIDVAETPIAQKRIIATCKRLMKPVIVATQMLESMHHSNRPTRAEASDVANAVLDGADACMLSGETAIGHYPTLAVSTMNRIMRKTEQSILKQLGTTHAQVMPPSIERHQITLAVASGATRIAEAIDSKLIVIATHSGGTAWIKSTTRSLTATLALSDKIDSVRRMNLFWGIKPMHCIELQDSAKLIQHVSQWALRQTEAPQPTGKVMQAGDSMVIVSGTGVMNGVNNFVLVHTLRDPQSDNSATTS